MVLREDILKNLQGITKNKKKKSLTRRERYERVEEGTNMNITGQNDLV
jgi:hypothetical protein